MPPASLRRGALALAVLAVLACTTTTASAQDDVRPHSLEPGSWALGFRIGPDFQLSSLEGTLITIKKHTSAAGAWRAGVSFDMRDEGAEVVYEDPPFARQEVERFDGGIRLVLSRLQYAGVARDVNFYWALGPDVAWRNSRFETRFESLAFPDSEFEHSSRSTVLRLHLGGEVGGEWFMTRSLSLHAGYSASGGYSRQTDSTSDGQDEETTTWSVGGEGAWLGLNVYL